MNVSHLGYLVRFNFVDWLQITNHFLELEKIKDKQLDFKTNKVDIQMTR